MKMKSQTGVNVCIEEFSVTGTAKGGHPKQPAERLPASSTSLFRQPKETIADLQSHSLMEERYGIREEGMF
ncbi:MAG: hypothetical protein C0390_02895 [Syntrophus sp. (in: bacteria)]|nr:hypothetical protein [Syntrophus sp. (in: bacteria)]